MPQFFGYFGNGYHGPWERPTPTAAGNLLWVNWGDPALFEKLEVARHEGRRVIVNVSMLIFLSYPSTTFSLPAVEFNDWSDQWTQIARDDLVVAFLIADEPWRYNKNYPTGYTMQQVSDNLHRAALAVKALWPRASVCVTASGYELVSYPIPAAVDWLGMYAYSYNTHWLQLYYYFHALRWRKTASQKIMAVADAYNKLAPAPQDEQRIWDYNRSWMSLVNGYKNDVVAVCPFLYQTMPGFGYGAESMPLVRAQLDRWAARIVGGASV